LLVGVKHTVNHAHVLLALLLEHLSGIEVALVDILPTIIRGSEIVPGVREPEWVHIGRQHHPVLAHLPGHLSGALRVSRQGTHAPCHSTQGLQSARGNLRLASNVVSGDVRIRFCYVANDWYVRYCACR
jgi:hypothetical protein